MHLVVGATGGVGLALLKALRARETPVRALVRSPDKLARLLGRDEPAGVEVVQGSADDSATLREAAQGATHLYYAVNPPYADWPARALPLLEAALDAAEAAGARFVFPGNVYAFGITGPEPVGEAHPARPHTRKGRIRAEMEARLWARHEAGRVPVVIGRFPDFYGPHANNLDLVVPPGRAILWGTRRNQPHEFIHIDDVGEALARLAGRDDAFGRAWHVPGPGMVTGGQWVAEVEAVLGHRPKVRVFRRAHLRFMGLFDRQIGEYGEMYYLWRHPLRLDGSRWERELGPLPTRTYREGIRQTAEALGLLPEG